MERYFAVNTAVYIILLRVQQVLSVLDILDRTFRVSGLARWKEFVVYSSHEICIIMWKCNCILCTFTRDIIMSFQWTHNGRDSVSYHQPHYCLLNRSLRLRSKKHSKLRVNGLCAGYSPFTGKVPAQMASNAENVSIWWRHHVEQSVFCRDLTKVSSGSTRCVAWYSIWCYFSPWDIERLE